jgi:hypothetical protein
MSLRECPHGLFEATTRQVAEAFQSIVSFGVVSLYNMIGSCYDYQDVVVMVLRKKVV